MAGDLGIGAQGGGQNDPDLALLHEVARAVADAGLGPAIGDELKAKGRAIEVARLLRVPDVELDIVGPVDRKRIVRRFGRRQRLSRHVSSWFPRLPDVK